MNVEYLKNKEFLIKLGNQLRKLRLEGKMTQENLANEIGTTISQISRLERGVLNTSVSTIHAISVALKLPIKDFFDFE